MEMKKWLVIGFLLISGCLSTHQLSSSVISRSQNDIHFQNKFVKIPKISRVYVSYSNDGYDSMRSYPGSGLEAMHVIREVFKSYVLQLTCAKSYKSSEAEYLYAREKKYDYFILPRLTNWTDSYTLLTGVPDQVAMNLKIYDLHANKLIDEITFSSVSSEIPGYSQTPRDLMHNGLRDVAHHLFI